MSQIAIRRLGAVSLTLLVSLALLVTGTSVAAANGTGHHSGQHHGHGAHGHQPVGKGKFEPSPADFDDTFSACGTTVRVQVGDQNAVVSRTTTQRDGSVFEEFKGPLTVDVTAPGHKPLDELDNSGPFTFLTNAAGTSSILTVKAPGLIYPFSDAEAAVFAAAGLPQGFYFTSGKLVARLDANFEVVTIIQRPRHLTDVCDLLKPKRST